LYKNEIKLQLIAGFLQKQNAHQGANVGGSNISAENFESPLQMMWSVILIAF